MHQHYNEPGTSSKSALNPTKYSLRDYVPLIVVFAVIALSSAAHVYVTGATVSSWSMALMGYFFLFFALFKLIDLSGFKDGFAHYDIIAKRVPIWGYIYPFVELGLGLLYLLAFQDPLLYVVTILITVVNVISVLIKLAKKEVFMCACLGTVLKVPLTTVTLIEYGLMGIMAIGMLAL